MYNREGVQRPPMAKINITQLVERYIAARDMKTKLDNAHKAKLEPLIGAMEKTEAAILDFFNKHNMDSAKCAAGTAYKASRSSATVADMDAFLAFVRENEAWPVSYTHLRAHET